MIPSTTGASEIRISGTVQGVGFRPTVWRLAREEGLVGEVLNDGEGVLIRTVGNTDAIDRLLRRIREEAPVLARIESMRQSPLSPPPAFPDFRIVESAAGQNRTRIAADAATCARCRDEVLDPADRRFQYPFTNCTHCGPRFSIVFGVPYDRARTTMAAFPMCEDCRREYEDPADRRFHAQPTACPICGPAIWFELPVGGTVARGHQALLTATEHIRSGGIVAMRGLGGFHLICDAGDDAAVQLLRERKHRYAKPLGLMARDLAMVQRYCGVPPGCAELLSGPEAPIVLLPASGPERLPEAVAPGLDLLGFMLPYTPLHTLLMQELDRPVVMTSANLSSEPQVTGIEEAREKLCGIADAFLMHDREIANRIDDSVLRLAGGRARMLRRARGYAPRAVPLPAGFERAPDVLALGGELKATFCLIKSGAAVLSQHQGDLEEASTFEDYQKNLKLYAEMYDHVPTLLVADLHPEYLSSKLGRELSEAEGLPLVQIQHHHAHLASCLAENGVPRDAAPVVGLILDGLGFGADGAIWGGEVLLGGYTKAHRLAGLKPVAMIGGMRAILEPWRNTYAHLAAAFGWEDFSQRSSSLALHSRLAAKPLATIERMLATGLNCPPASSCGRLFDAVAAAAGLCFDSAAYEGQGAMALEAAARQGLAIDDQAYPVRIIAPTAGVIGQLDPGLLWEALLRDLQDGTALSVMAARFHRGLAQGLVELVQAAIASLPGPRPDTVALSGGCMQNAVLLEELQMRFQKAGLKTLSHETIPANDGGIALGQALIAAAREIAAQEAPAHQSQSFIQPERSALCA